MMDDIATDLPFQYRIQILSAVIDAYVDAVKRGDYTLTERDKTAIKQLIAVLEMLQKALA